MRIYVKNDEAMKKRRLERRLKYLSISYDKRIDKYILVDDYILESVHLKIENNNFMVCDGGSASTEYRRLVKKFLIKEKLIKEELKWCLLRKITKLY